MQTERLPIRLDRYGNWFHGDRKIVNDTIIKIFWKSLKLEKDGRYFLEIENEKEEVIIESFPAFIIKDLNIENSNLYIKLPYDEIILYNREIIINNEVDILFCIESIKHIGILDKRLNGYFLQRIESYGDSLFFIESGIKRKVLTEFFSSPKDLISYCKIF